MKQVWFDCKTNPPKNGQFVRTKIDVPIWGDREIPLQWDSGAWFFIDGTVCHNYQPTHWREWERWKYSDSQDVFSDVFGEVFESHEDGNYDWEEANIEIHVDFESSDPVELDCAQFSLNVSNCELCPTDPNVVVKYSAARKVFLAAELLREELFLYDLLNAQKLDSETDK